jgi:hypothetical protein
VVLSVQHAALEPSRYKKINDAYSALQKFQESTLFAIVVPWKAAWHCDLAGSVCGLAFMLRTPF